MKTLIGATAALYLAIFAAGCSITSLDPESGPTEVTPAVLCYEGYSYIVVDGDTVPSPQTLGGYPDYSCPQN